MADGSTNPRTDSTYASHVSARLQNLRDLLNNERRSTADQRRALEALDQEVDDIISDRQRDRSGTERTSSLNDRRRPRSDTTSTESRDLIPTPANIPSTTNPSNLVRTRRRAFRPSERLSRSHRERLGQGVSIMTSPSYYTPPPRLSPLLPNPETVIHDHVIETQVDQDYSYRAKRRKLDDGTSESETKPFTYGHKGQVVPGQLKLDIINCEGGEDSEAHDIPCFPSQNVLRDDSSVYTTNTNKCVMLLKHATGMPFALTEVVIKAPKEGPPVAVQEGMIFVAMDETRILHKTSDYDSHYAPRGHRYHRQRLLDTQTSSQQYLQRSRSPMPHWSRLLRDFSPYTSRTAHEELLDSAVVPGFSVQTGIPSGSEDHPDRPLSPRPWHINTSNFDLDYSLRRYPDRYRPNNDLDLLAHTDNDSGTTSDSDDGATADEAIEESQDPEVLRLRDRRDRLRGTTFIGTGQLDRILQEEASIDAEIAVLTRRRRVAQQNQNRYVPPPPQSATAAQGGSDGPPSYTRRPETSSNLSFESRVPRTFAPAYGAPDPASQMGPYRHQRIPPPLSRPPVDQEDDDGSGGGSRPSSGVAPNTDGGSSSSTAKSTTDTTGTGLSSTVPPDMVVPHARFVIHRHRPHISIKFDPPVAGRYILIRLWAACPNQRIDIESVAAFGYGGPRFFPGVEMR